MFRIAPPEFCASFGSYIQLKSAANFIPYGSPPFARVQHIKLPGMIRDNDSSLAHNWGLIAKSIV